MNNLIYSQYIYILLEGHANRYTSALKHSVKDCIAPLSLIGTFVIQNRYPNSDTNFILGDFILILTETNK